MAYTPGKGTTMSVVVNSTVTTIGQITSITPPQMEMGSVETTHLTSTWREFQSTIKDGGELAFSIEWDPADASHVGLLGNFSSGTAVAWVVNFNDTGTATAAFAGFLTAFQFQELTVDNVSLVNLTVRSTSAVTIST